MDIDSQPPGPAAVPRRSYQQHCGIAIALDRVGDRWTLLILRELWLGDRRFTDLRRALPGIATNTLADRLRDLERDDLIERRALSPPAARTVYAMTTEGIRAVPILRALARFGMPFLTDPADGVVQPIMAVRALGALFDPVAAGAGDLRVRFDLDGEQLWLQARAGELVPAGRGGAPHLTVTGSAAALVEACRGGADLATFGPRLHIDGSALDKKRFAAIFPPWCS